jgi:hypothetical protein
MATASKCRSPIWNFFSISTNDASKAICKCGGVISRGKSLHTYGTTPLINHLKSKHQTTYYKEFQNAVDKRDAVVAEARVSVVSYSFVFIPNHN